MAQSTRKRTPKPRRQQQPNQTPEVETTAAKLFALCDTFQAIANLSWDIPHVDLFRGHSDPKVELDESLWIRLSICIRQRITGVASTLTCTQS